MQSSDWIKAKRLVSFVMWVAALLPLKLAAQPADATLSGLIGSIKAQKESALDPRRTAKPQPDPTPKVLQQKTPIVWSIFGLNQAFSALVVMDGKTHVLRSTDLPYQASGWKVLSMDATGLQVQGHGRRLWLPAPDVGTRPELYLQELGATVATNNALGASDADILSQRLPLQTSQFSVPPSQPLNASVLSGQPGQVPASPAVGLSPAQVKASSLSQYSARGPVPSLADSKSLEKR